MLKEKGKQQQHNFLSSFLFNLFVNLMVIYLSNPLLVVIEEMPRGKWEKNRVKAPRVRENWGDDPNLAPARGMSSQPSP